MILSVYSVWLLVRLTCNQADTVVAATSHTRSNGVCKRSEIASVCYRAYKLGKKRWSYNQCELVLTQQGSTSPSEVTVVEATAVHVHHPAMHSHVSESQVSRGLLCSSLPSALVCVAMLSQSTCDMTSQASYDMKLSNNQTVHVAVFLVYSSPDAEVTEERNGAEQKSYQWKIISRSK